jgi:hypothetical protein
VINSNLNEYLMFQLSIMSRGQRNQKGEKKRSESRRLFKFGERYRIKKSVASGENSLFYIFLSLGIPYYQGEYGKCVEDHQ